MEKQAHRPINCIGYNLIDCLNLYHYYQIKMWCIFFTALSEPQPETQDDDPEILLERYIN